MAVTMPTVTQLMHTVTAFAQNSETVLYEGWNFNSGNYLFTTDTK